MVVVVETAYSYLMSVCRCAMICTLPRAGPEKTYIDGSLHFYINPTISPFWTSSMCFTVTILTRSTCRQLLWGVFRCGLGFWRQKSMCTTYSIALILTDHFSLMWANKLASWLESRCFAKGNIF